MMLEQRMPTGMDTGVVREVMDTAEAAAYIGCSVGYVIKMRGDGTGPKYFRLFVRKGVRYLKEDLDVWMAARRFGSTSEYPEALH